MSLATGGSAQQVKILRVGLAEDPDILDPTLARTFVGRIVFASLCDKLYDINENGVIIPQLATALPEVSPDNKSLTIKLRQGVKFHDGTDFNAEAAKFSLDRHFNLPGSRRKSEIAQMAGVDVVDPFTIRIRLTTPAAQLLAQLADRAGMMVSPKAATALGDKFGTQPVCAGPYKFVERVAQDRIVLEKFDGYWEANRYLIGRIIYKIIVDSSVRLKNLQAGELDLIERVRPTDIKTIQLDPNLGAGSFFARDSIGYQGLTINIANKDGIGKPPVNLGTPLAKDARVREALELAIDRNAINEVEFEGFYTVGCTPIPKPSPFFDNSRVCPERNVARAKELLAAAGFGSGVKFTLMTGNSPDAIRIGEIVRASAKEAGFDITLNPVEFATSLNLQDAGKYEAFLIGWSGRIDPDGNIHQFHTCGGALNATGVCDKAIDDLLNAARETFDFNKRFELYKNALDLILARRNIIYLYFPKNIVAFSKAVKGFVTFPDGLLRFRDVRLEK